MKRDRHQDASAHHRIDRKKLGIPEPNGLLKLTAAKQEIVVAWNDGQPEISWEKSEGIELEINRGTGWKLLLFTPASSIAGPRPPPPPATPAARQFRASLPQASQTAQARKS